MTEGYGTLNFMTKEQEEAVEKIKMKARPSYFIGYLEDRVEAVKDTEFTGAQDQEIRDLLDKVAELIHNIATEHYDLGIGDD